MSRSCDHTRPRTRATQNRIGDSHRSVGSSSYRDHHQNRSGHTVGIHQRAASQATALIWRNEFPVHYLSPAVVATHARTGKLRILYTRLSDKLVVSLGGSAWPLESPLSSLLHYHCILLIVRHIASIGNSFAVRAGTSCRARIGHSRR